MAEERLVTGLKNEDGTDTVTVLVRKPNSVDLRTAQIEYNKAMRVALESKVLLRQKLDDYLKEQGIWDDVKQAKYNDYISRINARETQLKKGGMTLKDAKVAALELKKLRNEFRDLIAERSVYDNTTAEGLADNARFDSLVSTCVVDPNTKKSVFANLDDYNAKSSEPWAIKAASELANMLYNLDPNYEDNLPENKFLKTFKFTDAEGRYINKDGHLIAIDENGVERLIDENNRYVAYDASGKQYFVTRDGKPVEDIVFSPFTDDDGNLLDENGNVIETAAPEPEDTAKKTKKKKSDTE